MQVRFTEEQTGLQAQAESYFAQHLTTEVLDRLATEPRCGPTTRALRETFGRDGWLGIAWPAEFGGRGGSVQDEHVVFDAGYRAGAPIPFLALKTVGPTLMRFGSNEQRTTYLPAILAGREEWAIGYSEAEAGSDLARLATRAVRDGDHYSISGAKVFTSGGDTADHIWLAARTGPAEDLHRNLSVFIVPTTAPGFSASPLPVMTGDHTSLTFYDDVRVPVGHRVGEEGQGWQIITSQLNRERVGIANRSASWSRQILEDVVAWARTHRAPDGTPHLDAAWVRERLAEAWTLVETATLMGWRAVDSLARDSLTPAEASSVKVLATEAHQDVCRLLLDVVGITGVLAPPAPHAAMRGRLEAQDRLATLYTFGGGANEIQRQIIAWSGLGLPRGSA